ncbi:hypothetical protein S2M10_17940 [Sphingomonas sp. S2M10]|uniref:hypothetical protein n=1 Tax=Sphingomonas sp. S2M10 TaxID=2705010 RepID=UPI00145719DA|nr:hypothetical protein [Sphingomonas sp. S2M10]NLS26807.1 hypothetical protein [Sphingomonas sp. S2M10]
MHTFDAGVALVIANDVRSTLQSVDSALADGARLLGAMLETAHASGLPVTESQRVLENVTSCLSNVVQGRSDMVDAVKRMTVIKRNSNLDVVDVGCDNPLPAKPSTFFTTAEAKVA